MDWEDNTVEEIKSFNQAEVIHTYSSAGTYTVSITGTIKGWRFNYAGDALKIIEIMQWGDLNLGNSGGYFAGSENLVLTATDALDLNGTTDLSDAFRNANSLGDAGSISGWNVSSVTDMSRMFSGASSFNWPLKKWDVSAVIGMSHMFSGASSFNQDLSSWNVSTVSDMTGMFDGVTLSLDNYDKILISSCLEVKLKYSGLKNAND